MTPFHLAFPVRDLDETRAFYEGVLGCTIGRSVRGLGRFRPLRPPDVGPCQARRAADGLGKVDGKAVPIPHFGVVLLMEDWRKLADRLAAQPSVDWIERPMIRFAGEPGEQATLFIRDPSGNALEFKGFRSLQQLFAH